jgi:hypothetical protein
MTSESTKSKLWIVKTLNKSIQEIYVQREIEARLYNHCCSGKTISIIYSELVFVALDIHHAVRIRPITLSSEACLTLLYFSTLSHKRHDLRGENILNIKYVFSFSIQFLS